MAHEFRADLHVVPAARLERVREVVADLPHVLIAVAGRVGVRVERETGERDARVAVGDAVLRLPMLGPVDKRVRGEAVVAVAAFDLIEGTIADHGGQLTEVFLILLIVVDGRRRRGGGGAGAKRREGVLTRHLAHQTSLLRQLIIEPRTGDIASLLALAAPH